jgi:hypothetical protein
VESGDGTLVRSERGGLEEQLISNKVVYRFQSYAHLDLHVASSFLDSRKTTVLDVLTTALQNAPFDSFRQEIPDYPQQLFLRHLFIVEEVAFVVHTNHWRHSMLFYSRQVLPNKEIGDIDALSCRAQNRVTT